MPHGDPTLAFRLPALLLLALIPWLSSCAGARCEETSAFVLHSDAADMAMLSEQLLSRVFARLEGSRSLSEGYPNVGRIVLEPDPADSGAQTMRCDPGEASSPTDADCILLNEKGDFVKVQQVTWPSASFYMYRIFVAPGSPFFRVDRTQNFVALDVLLLEEPAFWELLDATIREAAGEIGARPLCQ